MRHQNRPQSRRCEPSQRKRPSPRRRLNLLKPQNLIGLNVGDVGEFFVSPDYVVFPGQGRAVEKDGPFALLDFSNGKAGAAGTAPVGSTLILTRNGAEVLRTKIADGPDFSMELKRVSTTNDVLSWRVEDSGGTVTHREDFGFPVRGATPGVVKYEINISEHSATAAN